MCPTYRNGCWPFVLKHVFAVPKYLESILYIPWSQMHNSSCDGIKGTSLRGLSAARKDYQKKRNRLISTKNEIIKLDTALM